MGGQKREGGKAEDSEIASPAERALERAVRALLKAPAPPRRSKMKSPTKKDLERRFVMRIGRDGKPKIREVD